MFFPLAGLDLQSRLLLPGIFNPPSFISMAKVNETGYCLNAKFLVIGIVRLPLFPC